MDHVMSQVIEDSISYLQDVFTNYRLGVTVGDLITKSCPL